MLKADHLLHLRATGRTTRMCHKAMHVALQEHRPVIIWCATLRHAEQVARQLEYCTRDAPRSDTLTCTRKKIPWGFEFTIGEDRIRIFAASAAADCGDLLHDPSVRGEARNTEYFADHYLVESMSPWLITQWEQFR